MPFVHHHAPDAKPANYDVFVVIQGDRFLGGPDASASVLFPTTEALYAWEAPRSEPLHIGLLEGRSYWVVEIESPDAAPPDGWLWHETRALLGNFTPEQSNAISCARQLLYWNRRHRFCGVCGTPTINLIEERAKRCPSCSSIFFPGVSPAVIVAVTRGDELLLAHNRNFRPGMFSLLAGFVDPGETLEQTVVREIREEVGIEVDTLRYVASQPWPFPNSLMLGFRARYDRGEIIVDGKEIEAAGWYRRDSLPDLPRKGTVARTLIDLWLAEDPAAS